MKNENPIIVVDNLIFEYVRDEEEVEVSVRAVDGVSFDVQKGSFTAIIGKNGSGKSTIAKNFNGLLLPTEGVVYIKGMNTKEENFIWDIRETAGMVFQNPDNQLVSSIVEDDVAFGPENLGLPRQEIRERVEFALESVDMTKHKNKSPHLLSGGQKQRIAIAGVVAMKPDCIIFDEPTAMLDPKGRDEIMAIIQELHAEGITVVLITHFMEETIDADRIIVVDEGKIVLQGTPEEVFENYEIIKKLSLDVPLAVNIARNLRNKGIDVPFVVKTEELIDYIWQYK